jgi:hypothetical protein
MHTCLAFKEVTYSAKDLDEQRHVEFVQRLCQGPCPSRLALQGTGERIGDLYRDCMPHMGRNRQYPLVTSNSYGKWIYYIVDLPINSMVIFYSYVSLPEDNWVNL